MYKALERASNLIAAAVLFMILMIMVCDVFGRYVLTRPVRGASEMIEVLMMVMIFIVMPSIAMRGEHITADVLSESKKKVFDTIQRVITGLVGSGFFAITGWKLWVLAIDVGTYGEATASLRIPISPLLYTMASFSVVNAIAFFSSMFVSMNKLDATIPATVEII